MINNLKINILELKTKHLKSNKNVYVCTCKSLICCSKQWQSLYMELQSFIGIVFNYIFNEVSIDFTVTFIVIFTVGEICMTNDQALEGICSEVSKCEAAVL